MKFIHTADIHLGCQPDRGFPWSRERSFDILTAFRDLISACRKERPDLLLIAGDLFHRQPALAELKEADTLFANIPEIPVVMIAGNHDCIRPGSALSEFSWSPNVTFLSGSGLSQVSFPKLGTVVHGFSYHTREIKDALYDDLKAPEDGNLHILLAHGGDADHIPLNRKKLAASGYSYIALGHIHKPEIDTENRLAFAGSLSPIELTETGHHGYIQGELLPEKGSGSLKLQFIPLASRSYIPCRVKVSSKTTNQSLYQTITKFMKQYGPSNIYKLALTGRRDPDIVFDEAYLRTAGRVVSYRDDTIPSYDIHALMENHRHDLIGDYIGAFLTDGTEASLTDPVKSQAFYYGLDALLANFDSETGEPQ
ncbi:DNA repair exonuclease [Lacrimispora sp. NSJ-141]|uniref:DNA repair exonuclease n=1 Tax=Lientehia hominis TaxID=2897778 RepID=A0AAP2RIY5_9FIRM|nr:DNA repair exonuclease [Lientehia hominis]MCD2492243.1 DNA repair exonuclease [Lientehia hominis]